MATDDGDVEYSSSKVNAGTRTFRNGVGERFHINFASFANLSFNRLAATVVSAEFAGHRCQ